jgi:hypothetical protein
MKRFIHLPSMFASMLVTTLGLLLLAPVVSLAGGLFYIDSITGFAGFGNTTPQSQVDVSGAIYSRLVTATSSTIDWNQSNVQDMVLSNNPTLAFSSGHAGGRYTLILNQDSTGGRTVTWPSSVLWAGGTKPILSSSANATDTVSFIYDGNSYLGSYATGYKPAGIAFDNSDSTQSNTGTSLSYSFTTAGDNRILIVRVGLSCGDHISTVTYNGVSMTQATKGTNTADSNFTQYLYYLKGPAAGANNVVINTDGTSCSILSNSESFTGAAQTGGVDVATPYYNSTQETGNITVSISVTATDSWLVGTQESQSANPVSVVNGAARNGVDQNTADSNGSVGSGTQTIGYDWTSLDRHSIIALAFAPE